MSQKITSKNLTYDTSLPPFLARLRGQQTAARNGGPDPILAANRRPGQKRSASEEAEDAPVVVDESGNVVDFRDGLLSLDDEGGKNRREGEEASKGGEEGKDTGRSASSRAKEKEKEKEKVAGIGASRKRKAGRVIGEERHSDDDDGDNDDDNDGKGRRAKRDRDDAARVAKASADVRRLVRGGKDEEGGRDDRDKHTPASVRATDDKKPAAGSQQQKTAIKGGAKKKAAKKIKLSFGDEGE